MNASIITGDVLSALRRRYGAHRQLGGGNVFAFGSSLTCSLNYSKLLRGDKYFFAVPKTILAPGQDLPKTEFGEFVLLICGSSDHVLVLPRSLIVEMLDQAPTRRVDIFLEQGAYILQTTRHPKRNVTEFLNAFPARGNSPRPVDDAPETPVTADRVHVKMQWSLIVLGRAAGCRVWVPTNDRNLSYRKQAFSTVTLNRLPNFGFDENTRRIVHNIDVLWLTNNVIHNAFEIEATTSVYSGLLRLNDLVLAQPNNQIKLYIAAADKRKDAVRSQLTRPTFQPLVATCHFISFEAIEEQTARLESLGIDTETRVSGLLRGEKFVLPEQAIYAERV